MLLKREIRNEVAAYLFLTPWLLGLLIFGIWPILHSAILSFTSFDLFRPMKFVGFDNFKYIFFEDKDFSQSLKVTALYVLMAVPLRLSFALFIAMLLNQKVRGMSFYRTIYYLPSIIGGGVAMSVTWRMFLSREGFLNVFLGSIGLNPIDFIGSPDFALQSLAAISAWQFGSSMVIFLAGLKQIPSELYEAAIVDGASSWQKFKKITVPQLTPVIFFNLVMAVIHAFQAFTPAVVITNNGGPVNATYLYVLNLYKMGFQSFRMGYASALAWILAIIVFSLTLLIFKSSDKWVYYEN